MNVNCVVIDRVYPVLFKLHEWITEMPGIQLLEMFENRKAAEKFMKHHEVNLIITHSDPKDLSWVKRVRARYQNIFVIILTEHEDARPIRARLSQVFHLKQSCEISDFEAAIGKARDYHRTLSLLRGR